LENSEDTTGTMYAGFWAFRSTSTMFSPESMMSCKVLVFTSVTLSFLLDGRAVLPLERAQGIQRRRCSARKPQRRRRQQKIEASHAMAGLRKFRQRRPVENRHPHGHEREHVKRRSEALARVRKFLDAVAAVDGDFTFVHPLSALGV